MGIFRRKKKRDSGEIIVFWFALIFRVMLVIAVILSIYFNQWENLLAASTALFLTFVPALAEKRLKLDTPSYFELIILIFIFFAIFLGEVFSFYQRIPYWDAMLHLAAGIIIAAVGFALINVLNGNPRIAVKLSPFFIALFGFCLAVALGTLWEIYEFWQDACFGFNMQKTGLDDTMKDLILDAFGALLVSTIGFFCIRKDHNSIKWFNKRILDKA